MEYLNKLPEVTELTEKYPLSEQEKKNRAELLHNIKAILEEKNTRKLLIIGPCSADREDAVLAYAERLAKLQEKVSDVFLIIPRVYTGKPRTTGMGYKGLVHRPSANSADDNIVQGLIATRKMHQLIIKNTGMFPADEMLYPEIFSYVEDMLVYVAVGARSVENQQHRLIASGIDIPVGMKNPISGNIETMLNAIVASHSAQHFVHNGWETKSHGNVYAHAVLRGFVDNGGKIMPNYYYENILELRDKYFKKNLSNPSVIIDCNHCNSGKQYDEQGRIAEYLFEMCKKNKNINAFVKGIMIESYLEDGAQLVGEGIFGKSITDPCLGWSKTEKLILELADLV